MVLSVSGSQTMGANLPPLKLVNFATNLSPNAGSLSRIVHLKMHTLNVYGESFNAAFASNWLTATCLFHFGTMQPGTQHNFTTYFPDTPMWIINHHMKHSSMRSLISPASEFGGACAFARSAMKTTATRAFHLPVSRPFILDATNIDEAGWSIFLHSTESLPREMLHSMSNDSCALTKMAQLWTTLQSLLKMTARTWHQCGCTMTHSSRVTGEVMLLTRVVPLTGETPRLNRLSQHRCQIQRLVPELLNEVGLDGLTQMLQIVTSLLVSVRILIAPSHRSMVDTMDRVRSSVLGTAMAFPLRVLDNVWLAVCIQMPFCSAFRLSCLRRTLRITPTRLGASTWTDLARSPSQTRMRKPWRRDLPTSGRKQWIARSASFSNALA